jgi:hypothetical protein
VVPGSVGIGIGGSAEIGIDTGGTTIVGVGDEVGIAGTGLGAGKVGVDSVGTTLAESANDVVLPDGVAIAVCFEAAGRGGGKVMIGGAGDGRAGAIGGVAETTGAGGKTGDSTGARIGPTSVAFFETVWA